MVRQGFPNFDSSISSMLPIPPVLVLPPVSGVIHALHTEQGRESFSASEGHCLLEEIDSEDF